MSDNWKPGDLACLIETGASGDGCVGSYAPGSTHMRKGGVYLVERVVTDRGLVGLVIDGHHSTHFTRSWRATCFKRVPPHTPDATDAEVIALLNGAGVKEASDA